MSDVTARSSVTVSWACWALKEERMGIIRTIANGPHWRMTRPSGSMVGQGHGVVE